MQRIDLTGLRVKTFTVLEYAGQKQNPKWLCVCDCGIKRELLGRCLRKGKVRCDCQIRVTLHPLCRVWFGMKSRCFNIKSSKYKAYGGRGITICDRWLDFNNFVSDMGQRPPNTSIDRINNDGDYEPSNCRWATAKVQCNNHRRNTFLKHNGVTKKVSEWASELGITRQAMEQRIKDKHPPEKLFHKGPFLHTGPRKKYKKRVVKAEIVGYIF